MRHLFVPSYLTQGRPHRIYQQLGVDRCSTGQGGRAWLNMEKEPNTPHRTGKYKLLLFRPCPNGHTGLGTTTRCGPMQLWSTLPHKVKQSQQSVDLCGYGNQLPHRILSTMGVERCSNGPLQKEGELPHRA